MSATPHEPDLNSLAAFADGMLPRDQRARVADHLASCRECRAIVAELARDRTSSQARARPWLLPLAASVLLAGVAGALYWSVTPPAAPAASPVIAPAPAPPDRSAPSEATPAAPAPTPQAPPARDTMRSAAERRIDGKTLRLVAGEWIDVDYDPAAALPVRRMTTPEERDRALDQNPALAPFARLGRATVVLNGIVYRIDLKAP